MPQVKPEDAMELGRVDGFDQDEYRGYCDDGAEVSCGFLAAQGDAFEALELSHHLFDARTPSIERLGEVAGNIAPEGLSLSIRFLNMLWPWMRNSDKNIS